MDNAAKIKALEENGAFEQELAKVNTPEEMQALFANYGIEMTLDEIRAMVAEAVKMNESEGGELNEEDLDNVAGGVWYVVVGKWALKTVASWAIGKVLSKITGW
jgi:hypothetical protein